MGELTPNGSVNPARAYPAPGFARLVVRGLGRRCPRCGGGKLFKGYFSMVEECPTCHYRFETAPQEGSFFLGALTINTGIILVAVLLTLFIYIALLAAGGGDGPPVAPWIIGGSIGCIVLPIVAYPISKTLWAAIDYGLHHEDRRPGRMMEG